MNRPTRRDDECLSLIARHTKLAVDELRAEGIEFTDKLFWATVEKDGQVKFCDWHPFESPEYSIVQRIWGDSWLECNAKLAAVGYKIVFGTGKNVSLWSEFDRLFENRRREKQIRTGTLRERIKLNNQNKGASDIAGQKT